MRLLNAVDIWILDYKKLSPLSYDWESLLSIEEHQRANRFHFENDKHSFIVYHACKRLILSEYLKQAPKEIVISFQEKGKPFLKNTPLTFNLSHTKEMAILAVSSDVEVGVDIEKIKNSADYLAIAKRFFHPDEYHQLMNTENPQKQLDTFFTLWTAKEAILKATGEGIAAGLNNFSVQHDDSHPKILKHTYSRDIALTLLQTPANYVAVLAITGEKKSIVYRELSILL